MTIDLDSTVCEVHGHHKRGAAYGYTHKLGYHLLLATRAGTGEVLHARQRTGRANTARSTARFVDEPDADTTFQRGQSTHRQLSHRRPS